MQRSEIEDLYESLRHFREQNLSVVGGENVVRTPQFLLSSVQQGRSVMAFRGEGQNTMIADITDEDVVVTVAGNTARVTELVI